MIVRLGGRRNEQQRVFASHPASRHEAIVDHALGRTERVRLSPIDRRFLSLLGEVRAELQALRREL